MITKSISEGGNIGNESNDKTYALVGPFAWWRLTLVDKFNKGLDLSGLTRCTIQFHVPIIRLTSKEEICEIISS